jgi:hypothetical protein
MYRKVWYTMVEEIDGQGPGATDMGNESDCYIRFGYSISNVLCTYEVKQNKRSNKYTETCLPLAQLKV